MNKPTSFWTKISEKHEHHPDVTPRTDLDVTPQILLIGVPLLLLFAALAWFFLSR